MTLSEKTMKTPQPNQRKYPYVVRRIIATVYQHIEVIFTAERTNPPQGGLHIAIGQTPYDEDGHLKEEARNALIDVLKEMTRTSRLRMCAVFGEKDTVYVEPDGEVNYKTEAPSGGINL